MSMKIGILPSVKQPFSLTLSHVGLFREARIIWAGVEASEPLNQLAECVRSSLSAADVPFDPKPFVPHITLGWKPIVPVAFDLSEIIIPTAEMTVSDVFLYAHCHGEHRFHDSIEGRHHGIMYRLVSGDYLKWMPLQIL